MERRHDGKRPRWVPWIVVSAWATSIFATSSTVIDRETFLRWVARVLPAGPVFDGFSRFYHRFGILLVKGWHMTEFAILFLVIYWAARAAVRLAAPWAAAFAATVAALYAASDEWHQTFVPGRGGTVSDVIIDCCGIALAALLALRVARRRPEVGAPAAAPSKTPA